MIGIVGGVGPMAGIDVFRKIAEETPASRDQDHADVLLFSFPGRITDRTEFLRGKEESNPAHAMARVILDLEKAGATVAGIPCNTAHAAPVFDVILSELQKNGSRLELLHMIREVVKYINQELSAKNIGILCTTGTSRSGVYRDALKEGGLIAVEPGEEWQERIHQAVYSREYGIKAKSFPIKEKARSQLIAAIEHLQTQGAEAVILGCTEIPLAIPEKSYLGLDLIDPNRILARALLAHEQKLQAKHDGTAKEKKNNF